MAAAFEEGALTGVGPCGGPDVSRSLVVAPVMPCDLTGAKEIREVYM